MVPSGGFNLHRRLDIFGDLGPSSLSTPH